MRSAVCICLINIIRKRNILKCCLNIDFFFKRAIKLNRFEFYGAWIDYWIVCSYFKVFQFYRLLMVYHFHIEYTMEHITVRLRNACQILKLYFEYYPFCYNWYVFRRSINWNRLLVFQLTYSKYHSSYFILINHDTN